MKVKNMEIDLADFDKDKMQAHHYLDIEVLHEYIDEHHFEIIVRRLDNEGKGGWIEISLLDLILLFVTFLLEATFIMKKEVSQLVIYENIELIKPENKVAFKADLENRLGLTINRIEITSVDFLKDTALIRVFHYETRKD